MGLGDIGRKKVEQRGDRGVFKQDTPCLQVVQVSQGCGGFGDFFNSLLDEGSGKGLGADRLAKKSGSRGDFGVVGVAGGEAGQGGLQACFVVVGESVAGGGAVRRRENFCFVAVAFWKLARSPCLVWSAQRDDNHNYAILNRGYAH